MSGLTSANQGDLLVFQPKPDLPPPRQIVGIIGWTRVNLFKGWIHTVLTLAA